MNRNILISAIFVTLCLTVFQQCSMGGNDGSLNQSSSGGPVADANLPRVSFDFPTLNLAGSASSFTLTGNCNPGPFTDFVIELGYRPNGTSSEVLKSYDESSCVNGRFSLTATVTEMQLSSSSPGVFSLRIRAQRASGEVEGPSVTSNLTWASSSSGGTTSGGTTTGATTGGTSGCWPSGHTRDNVEWCCSDTYEGQTPPGYMCP